MRIARKKSTLETLAPFLFPLVSATIALLVVATCIISFMLAAPGAIGDMQERIAAMKSGYEEVLGK